MGHPKDVHFWKNIINSLSDKGHEVNILVWEKDITSYLLDAYGFEYIVIGKSQKGFFKKAYGILEGDMKSLMFARKIKPDIFIAGAPYLAHISKLFGKPHISVTDTENARLIQYLTYPFSDVIFTPSCFQKKFNPQKHFTFEGYLELAYLHPRYFKPDSTVIDELDKDDKLIVLRFVSWGASHDIGQRGFTHQEEIVNKLKNYGKIFITSEKKLSKRLEKYRITIPPEKMHDLLYYATMYIGEGATMATEAGILGTPSIYVSSLVGTMGNFEELEKRYRLVYSFQDPTLALEKALELLNDNNIKEKWQKKREKLLKEKIDVTKFMINFIENYPESFKTLKESETSIRV